MIAAWGYAIAAVLLALLAWRAWIRLRVRLRLRAALRSPSESVRRSAVHECVALGATESARLLVRVIQREDSSAVLDELVIALAERQWEPVSKPDLVELRIWARGYAIDHPDLLAPAGPGEASRPVAAGGSGSTGESRGASGEDSGSDARGQDLQEDRAPQGTDGTQGTVILMRERRGRSKE